MRRPERADREPGSPVRDCVFLVLAIAPLLFFRLGVAPLANPDEGRYAEVPREMLLSSDFVLPRIDGVLFFDKPPLLYWLIAGAYRVFGETEWAARLIPSLAGLFACLAVYLLARRPLGRRPALAGALVLGTSILWVALSRIVLTDMLVSALLSTTLLAFLAAFHEPPGTRRRLLFTLVYLAAALATLAKGLIGFLLPGAVIFLFLLVRKGWSRLRPFHLPSGALLFLAVALPWHLLAASRHPLFASYYFVHEHFERFFTAGHGRSQPFWFFLPVLVIGLFPWFGFLPAALRRAKDDAAWFLLIWAGFILLFFSVSSSKLIPYILPAMPPLALLIGREIVDLWDANSSRIPAGLRTASGFAALLAVASTVLVAGFLPARFHALGIPALLCALAFAVLACAVPLAARTRAARGGLVALWLGQSALLLVATTVTSAAQGPSAKPFTELLRHEAGRELVLCYGDLRRDVPFYTKRYVGTVRYSSELAFGLSIEDHSALFLDDAGFRERWSDGKRVWLIAKQGQLEALRRDRTFQYRERARSGDLFLLTNEHL